jgi:hypothetical protein
MKSGLWFRYVGAAMFCLFVSGSADYSGSAQRSQSAAVMLDVARNYLVSLSAGQLAKVKIGFATEERMNWHYIPRPRKGLPFAEMDAAQQHLARALLSSGLSQRGYIKASTIMSLETILKELEQGSGPLRDPQLYYFSVFGEPSADRAWGWRVEGHHLSLNFTLAEGQLVASTPSFFGSNPAEVRQGPRKGLRVLAGEEDRARALLQSLSESQRRTAIIQADAPGDILTANHRKADIGSPAGLPATALTPPQVDLLMDLVGEYAWNMPEDISSERIRQLREAGIEKIHFAWAGSLERGKPHYYRVQGPTFLIEYDNTQNDANHIHAVWRNLLGDFGADLLGQHLKESHHAAPK